MSAPSNWKILIRPYKTYLKTVYPAPADATNSIKSRYWSLKAKKTDFNWFDGRPIPRIRSDMAAAIERALVPMSVEDALAKRKTGDTMKVKVFIHHERPTNAADAPISSLSGAKVSVRELSITVPVNTKDDKVMFRKLMSITKPWASRLMSELDNWKRLGAPNQHPVKAYFKQYADVEKWLSENNVGWFDAEGSNDESIWWVVPTKTRAHLRPKNASRAGPAYNHPSSNCAIESIQLAMNPIDAKQEKVFSSLKSKYSGGVYPDDYAEIAKKLGRRIDITFAPSSSIARRWVDAGHKTDQQVYASFGGKTRKAIHIHHWGNHATAMLQKPVHEYRYVSVDEMAKEAFDRYEQIYQTGEYHITFRNKLDGVFETIQLSSIDGVELELGKTTPQSQLYDEFKKQIVAYSYNDPNREQYDQFCKHGIHYSIGEEDTSDFDFDLKSAYSNYATMPCYRGLPRDITYWFNNPTIEQVQANSGFVLTRFTDPIKNCEITAWLACSAIDLLHEHGLVHEMTQAAFAQSTFDLDMTKFVGPNIGKRVFHKILGLSTQLKAKKRFITADPIEVFDEYVAQLQMPTCVQMNDDIRSVLANHVSIGVTYDLETDRYSHVAATIQDCITTELWRKWLEVKVANPKATVVTALVDGLRIRSDDFDYSTFNFDDGRWAPKATNKCFTLPQCDWVHRSATKAKLAATKLTRVDWSIKIEDEYVDMLSVSNNDNSFASLVGEGYINGLQGFAGCGKSWNIRELLEQFNAVVLTPTHSTREDMSTYSIRNYIDDETLNTIPCKTYQSVIQRAGSIRDYQVIIIDEAGMLLAEHLNRIVEMAGRKLILLVGDPAQHKPILGSRMTLEAKYLMYREYIDSDEKLNEIYANGSDWERNNMLSYLPYDATFKEPEQSEDDSDEDHFDKVEQLRSQYVAKRREETQKVRFLLASLFKYKVARDVAAFDTYTGGKTLDVVKRAEESDDGKALIKLCSDVRETGIEAILKYCRKNPQFRVNPTDPTICSNVDSTAVISCRNSEVDMFNDGFKKTLRQMSNVDATTKLEANLKKIVDDEFSSELAKKEAAFKLNYAYVDVDIRIVAKSTFSVKDGVQIYNGTKGTLRNFMITFDGCDFEVALTEIAKPTRVSAKNPFKRPVLKIADVVPLYAITSYRAQGRTMSDGMIYVDCSNLTYEMLYVAVSRARRISQLRFVYDEPEYDDQGIRVAGPRILEAYEDDAEYVSIPNELKLGFKVSNSSNILAVDNKRKLANLTRDWTSFDWISAIADIDTKLEGSMNQFLANYSKASDELKANMSPPTWADCAKEAITKLQSPKEAKPIEGSVQDKWFELFTLLDRMGAHFIRGKDHSPHLLTRAKYYQMIAVMANEGVSVPDQRETIKAVRDYNESVYSYEELGCESMFAGEREIFSKWTLDRWINNLVIINNDADIELWRDMYL